MKNSLSVLLPLLVLMLSGPVPGQQALAQNESGDNPIVGQRLWLPPSHAHLRPMLEYAVRLALGNPDCMDVLYGRLNEFRSEREEPTLTILCQKDARSTFNLIYRASDLQAALDSQGVEFSDDDAAANLEALRRMLISNDELREQQQGNTAVAPGQPSGPASPASDADLDLELDLDELMENRPPEQEAPPSIF